MTARLGLGSAQFGDAYGISNRHGRVSEDEVRDILALAAQNKLIDIDVAPYHGDVERIVGRSQPFPSPLRVQIRTLRLDKGLDWLESRLKRSIDHLGLAKTHAALVDQASDLLGPDGDALWARLLKLKSSGLISQIGISAQYEDQPLLLAKRFKPDIIQVQASIFDQRLVHSGDIAAMAELGVKVQIRSVFMQGLLFAPSDALPPRLTPLIPALSRIKRLMLESGADPLHAALSYGLHIKGADMVMVGVTSAAELRAILAASQRPRPKIEWEALALDNEAALDQRGWFDKDVQASPHWVRVA